MKGMAVKDPMGWFRRQPAPVSLALTIVVILGALITWAQPELMKKNFAFDGTAFPKIWTLFTYPLVNPVLTGSAGPLFTVFLAMWLLNVGRMLEGDHGSKKFLGLWFALTLVGVLPLAIFKFAAYGTLVPVAMMTVIWGTRFQNSTVMLFGLVPVLGKWIAVMSVLSVFFSYASSGSMFFAGILACIGCGVAYLYAANKIPKVPYGLRHGTYVKPKPTKAQIEKEKQYYEDVHRREKEREERERLRKLFESSLGDDK